MKNKKTLRDRAIVTNSNYSFANTSDHSTSESEIAAIADAGPQKRSALSCHLSAPRLQQRCISSPACRSQTTARLYRSEQTRELKRGSAELYSPTSRKASATSKYRSPISSGFCSTRVVKRGFKENHTNQ